MTRDQAREVLQAYRPGRDESELLVAEALEWVRRDPELQRELETQQKLDAVISRKLKQTLTPPDLLAQIHTGVAARQSRRWQQVALVAACLVLSGVLVVLWVNRNQDTDASGFAAYRADMAQFLKTFPRLDVETEKHADMRRWLADKHALTQFQIPAGLEKFPGIGCRTIQWRDKELALLCFMVDGEVVHLFVLRGAEFPEASFASGPQFARSGEFATASWRKGDMAYLALTRGSEGFLRNHL